jgi:hypothetical protein
VAATAAGLEKGRARTRRLAHPLARSHSTSSRRLTHAHAAASTVVVVVVVKSVKEEGEEVLIWTFLFVPTAVTAAGGDAGGREGGHAPAQRAQRTTVALRPAGSAPLCAAMISFAAVWSSTWPLPDTARSQAAHTCGHQRGLRYPHEQKGTESDERRRTEFSPPLLLLLELLLLLLLEMPLLVVLPLLPISPMRGGGGEPFRHPRTQREGCHGPAPPEPPARKLSLGQARRLRTRPRTALRRLWCCSWLRQLHSHHPPRHRHRHHRSQRSLECRCARKG